MFSIFCRCGYSNVLKANRLQIDWTVLVYYYMVIITTFTNENIDPYKHLTAKNYYKCLVKHIQ